MGPYVWPMPRGVRRSFMVGTNYSSDRHSEMPSDLDILRKLNFYIKKSCTTFHSTMIKLHGLRMQHPFKCRLVAGWFPRKHLIVHEQPSRNQILSGTQLWLQMFLCVWEKWMTWLSSAAVLMSAGCDHCLDNDFREMTIYYSVVL